MKPIYSLKIEKRWQRIWKKVGLYTTLDEVKGKKNFYSLVMFPYPSGDLHMGHWYNFAGADIYTRFKRMEGFNVMFPIGFDAFGLPAENAAIKNNIHPRKWTYDNIKRMRKQLVSIGASFDWSREIITCDPSYYKWTQWMFLQFYKAGLVYRAKVPCNFCPSCKTVLANEQVVDGKCDRCGTEVIQKKIEQWVFKITDFAELLLKGLKNIDWPEKTKMMQRNWIGKSEGWEIRFKVKLRTANSAQEDRKDLSVFTTRADTLFGVTYLVLAPEHPIIKDIGDQIINYDSIRKYIEESRRKTERERISNVKDKTGIKLEGVTAINPANGKEVPIFVADYVLSSYGTGAIMAVPAHDQRDLDFAKKHNLAIITVIRSTSKQDLSPKDVSLVVSDGFTKAMEDDGILINSGRFNGMSSVDARKRIGEWLKSKGIAKKVIHYKLRDWLISRQRYWGAPIPMVYCKKCGWQPVKEEDLPVLLPRVENFKPTGEGRSPLAKSEKFVKTVCPKCGGEAVRETDTMDTFVDSSWYFLRYVDPKNNKVFASGEKIKKWLPVDMYIGGAEHAVMHLLYVRFFTKVLNKLGYLGFDEPVSVLRHQGIILGPDGQKMSKSKGNVVNPDIQVKKYGSDVIRIYLCFMGPYDQGGPWDPNGITGIVRFLNRFWDYVTFVIKVQKREGFSLETGCSEVVFLNKTIKKVTDDIRNFRFNVAISSIMELLNFLMNRRGINTRNSKNKNKKFYRILGISDLKNLLIILSPFAPHLTEELWRRAKTYPCSLRQFKAADSIHSQSWPKYKSDLTKEESIEFVVQINGRVRDKFKVRSGLSEKKLKLISLSREKVKKWVGLNKIKKTIFIPDKLINIVI